MLGVADWIERVYNRRRRHAALNMLPRYGLNSSTVSWEKPPDPPSTNKGQAHRQRFDPGLQSNLG